MERIVCDAIDSSNTVQFFYDGGIRHVEPYCLGVSRNGKLLLRAFQIAGFSNSGDPSGWRLFDISKIAGTITIGPLFVPGRASYNPNDSAMTQIYCRV